MYSVNREFHAGNVSTVLEDIITFVPRWTSWQPSLTYKGALTNYLTHPESFTYHLPAHMDMVEGALVEPAAVACMQPSLQG